MNNLLKECGIDVGSKRVSLINGMRLLRSNSLIDENTSAMLNDLRAITSSAAHGGMVTKDDATRTKRLADIFLARLDPNQYRTGGM